MLLTKLHIPQTGENIIHRSSLFEKLDEGLKRKLILVSATAGYGKTTLISSWISKNKLTTAWYSLDEKDNDVNVFLSYVIAALQTIDKSIGSELKQTLADPEELSVELITELLVSDLLETDKNTLLVLDDFHYIHDRDVINFISNIIEYMPSNFHLLIITRNDPAFQISKLRSKQQLLEVRSNDLRFSKNDIAKLFKKLYQLSLTDDNANMLHDKTEGWISGIHLAGISIQRQENVSHFINNLKGSNRYIMDYLIDEVLSSLDASVKDFLLKTSILKRFNAELCDYILNSNKSSEILRILEKNNLFIIPLDNERKWYRYHHLFSDLLKIRLKNFQTDFIDGLHKLAGEWLTNYHLLNEAIDHLLLAKDYQKAVKLISQEMLKIWDDGNHFRFSPWLKILPETLVNQIPQLLILKAELNMARWLIQDAEDLLKNAENLLNSIENQKLIPIIPISNQEIKNYKGRILVNNALNASYSEKPEEIIQYVKKALDTLSKDQITWRNLALMIRSDAYFILGKLNDAYIGQVEINKSYQMAQNPFLYIMSGANLVVTLRQQGKLHEVVQLCDKLLTYGIEKGLKNTTVIGWLLSIKGEILAEMNNTEEAEKIALEGFATAEKYRIVGMCLKCYLLLNRIYYSKRKYSEVYKVIQIVNDESLGFGITRHIKNQIDAWKIKISVSQKQFDEVKQWLIEYENQEDINFDYINENKHIAASIAYITLKKFRQAEELLETLIIDAERYERINTLIEIYKLKTILEYQRNEVEKSKEHLFKALLLAEPGGYIRTFIDEGEILETILKEIKKEKATKSNEVLDAISTDYLNLLLKEFEKEKKNQSIIEEETLTKRELETLKLIAEDYSNQDIANELFISKTTVKTHVGNILLKLEAKNRTEAVIIAKEKGIM
ncbi:MAG: hypothetical protein C0597_12515 [Marinilabiliales bacterium]|nr:MAG: hypothetical protein C0597_12515 [Marinilabiliales bacterium]